MADRLLRKKDMAAMLSLKNEEMAASILKEYGCYPIDLGPGRGRGLRWLESEVTYALRRMHMQAQPVKEQSVKKVLSKKIKFPKSDLDLVNKSSKETQALLTSEEAIQ